MQGCCLHGWTLVESLSLGVALVVLEYQVLDNRHLLFLQVILESFASPRLITVSSILAEMEPHVYPVSVGSPASVWKVRFVTLGKLFIFHFKS